MPASDASEPVSSLAGASSCCVFPLLLAELRRAQVRQRLDDVQLVRAAEKREEVLGVIGEDRQRACFGSCPVRIAGTACSVCGCTVVELRNHVAFLASEAKFGNRTASTRCARSISAIVGNSSKTTSTTGVVEPTATVFASRLLREDELRHGRVEEEQREEDDRRRDEEREERPHRLRAHVEHRAADADAARRRRARRARRGRRSSSARGGRSRATSPATKTRCSSPRRRRLTSPTSDLDARGARRAAAA